MAGVFGDLLSTLNVGFLLMRFCSECGGQVFLRWVDRDLIQRFVCERCNVVHYRNPRILVVCAVNHRDTVLLCRRANEPALGKWNAPSGFLEIGETLQEGAARETFEETGVRVDPAKLELYSIVNMPLIEQVAIVFRTNLSRPAKIKLGPESLDAAFVSEAEVQQLDFAWREYTGSGLDQYFEELRIGKFGVHLISAEIGDDRRRQERCYALDYSHQP